METLEEPEPLEPFQVRDQVQTAGWIFQRRKRRGQRSIDGTPQPIIQMAGSKTLSGPNQPTPVSTDVSENDSTEQNSTVPEKQNSSLTPAQENEVGSQSPRTNDVVAFDSEVHL